MEVPATALVDAIPGEGDELMEASVVLRRVRQEEPLFHGGEVVGFVERYRERAEGVLRLDRSELSFVPSHAPSNGGGTPPGAGTDFEEPSTDRDGTLRWSLLELRAIGSSSSSVQVQPRGEAAAEIRFPNDSPRRWEEALKRAVARSWWVGGRGRVVEFQPRIVAE